MTAQLAPKNRLASITNQNPTVGLALESIESAVANLAPSAIVACSVAQLNVLADNADGDPEAADAVEALRKETNGAKKWAFKNVTVEILAIVKAAIERKQAAAAPAAPAAPQSDEAGEN